MSWHLSPNSVNGGKPKGSCEARFDAENLESGMYLYRMIAREKDGPYLRFRRAVSDGDNVDSALVLLAIEILERLLGHEGLAIAFDKEEPPDQRPATAKQVRIGNTGFLGSFKSVDLELTDDLSHGG